MCLLENPENGQNDFCSKGRNFEQFDMRISCYFKLSQSLYQQQIFFFAIDSQTRLTTNFTEMRCFWKWYLHQYKILIILTM